MPDRETIIAAITPHCEALTAHDKAAWLEIWADDVVLEDPAGVDFYRGKDALATDFWALIEALTPMRMTLMEDIIVCGREAVAIFAADLTFEGAPRRTAPIVDHFTFNDAGKITSMRAFWKYD